MENMENKTAALKIVYTHDLLLLDHPYEYRWGETFKVGDCTGMRIAPGLNQVTYTLHHKSYLRQACAYPKNTYTSIPLAKYRMHVMNQNAISHN